MTVTAAAGDGEVERWGVHELTLEGPSGGNPFLDVELSGRYQYRNRVVDATGFYDDDGVYRIRFMPDQEGLWRFRTTSTARELDGLTGSFECVAPRLGNHGPVAVASETAFRYADGSPYRPFGTTCYHWTHELDHGREEQTLSALRSSAFNKVRMCVLPTRDLTPPRLPFQGTDPHGLDKTRFDTTFFHHLEDRIKDLGDIGVEADVILFHPYDHGYRGLDNMSSDDDERYARYVLARLAAYRNVWWSIANEYDFNRAKTIADWKRLLQLVRRSDPYGHLRSIHNGSLMYEHAPLFDFNDPSITHQSIQHWEASLVGTWLSGCPKPVIVDEIGYEGDGPRRWGNLTGEVLIDRFWRIVVSGGYVTHGECFTGFEGPPWMSAGGQLHGDCPPRVGFLRAIVEEGPVDSLQATRAGEHFLRYFGLGQPRRVVWDLPEEGFYQVDRIDAWNMTITPLGDHYRGRISIDLPGRPLMALRARRR